MKPKLLLSMMAAFALLAAACSGSDSAGTDAGESSGTDAGESSGGESSGGVAVDIEAMVAADLANCEPAPSGDPIVVGMAMDFSEVSGFVDAPGSALVPHVADLINCIGGVNGSPVEVRVEDVGGDAVTAGVAAETLLDAGAKFIVGPPFADFALPIIQASGGEVAMFVAASTEPTLADIDNNSYLVSFDDRGQSSAAAEWALEQGFTRGFVFTQPGPYTGVNPDIFAEVFEAGGGEIVSTQTYVWGADTDFSAQVAELSGVLEGNEVFFSAALGFQVTALRGQLEGAGFDDITYMGTDAMDATGIQFEDNNEGIIHTPHTNIVAGDLNDKLLASYTAATGEELESRGFMPLYVDSLLMGLQGIVDCGCTDTVGIGNAVAALDGFEGMSGLITYAGTNGIPPKAVPIVQITDGADKLIDTK